MPKRYARGTDFRLAQSAQAHPGGYGEKTWIFHELPQPVEQRPTHADSDRAHAAIPALYR